MQIHLIQPQLMLTHYAACTINFVDSPSFLVHGDILQRYVILARSLGKGGIEVETGSRSQIGNGAIRDWRTGGRHDLMFTLTVFGWEFLGRKNGPSARTEGVETELREK